MAAGFPSCLFTCCLNEAEGTWILTGSGHLILAGDEHILCAFLSLWQMEIRLRKKCAIGHTQEFWLLFCLLLRLVLDLCCNISHVQVLSQRKLHSMSENFVRQCTNNKAM